MEHWQEEQLHALLSSPSAEAFFAEIVALAGDLGFEYCAYGLRSPIPVSRPKVLTLNNYPPRWQTIYRQANYIAIDPTVHHAMTSPLPVVWSDKLFAAATPLWEEANAAGLRVGWALGIRGCDGFLSMATLARSCEPLSDTELRQKSTAMTWLAQIAHVGMSQRLCTNLVPELDSTLSRREVEILRWTAEGKTSGEIADILNITERTVNFHVGNAMNKLQASNKTAAAVRAALLGLL